MRYEKQYEHEQVTVLMPDSTAVLVIWQMRAVHFLILINIDHTEESKPI